MSADEQNTPDPYLRIGIAAVFLSCALFAVVRLAAQLANGLLTPWWGNALGALGTAGVWWWYHRDPASRYTPAVHACASIAVTCIYLPLFYGMPSTVWWLSLVAFAMVMMASATESAIWTGFILVLVAGAPVLPDAWMVEGAAGEQLIERIATRFFYVVTLLSIAFGFRREVERRADELAATAAALDQANQSKGRFLAHISHELRTPLHGVIAMTDLALREPLPNRARTQVRTAQTSANLLVRLLNDVLDISRAGNDALFLEIDTFDLHATLGDVLRPLSLRAAASGLTFTAGAEPSLVAEREGDASRVSQIALNLVGNALKFTEHGSVSVRLRHGRTPDEVLLVVEDTGRGIPPDEMERIFEPFTQVETTDAQRLGGAGLGLSIVRELVRRMGGSVKVEDLERGGARFTIGLPLPVRGDEAGPRQLLAPVVRAAPTDVNASKRLRILAAEDDPTNQLVLKAFLGRLGHDVIMVADGLEALAELRRSEFELVLTDLQMPRMDGVELIRSIRTSDADWRNISVVACTAQAQPADMAFFRDHAVAGHLSKPFTLDALARILKRFTSEV